MRSSLLLLSLLAATACRDTLPEEVDTDTEADTELDTAFDPGTEADTDTDVDTDSDTAAPIDADADGFTSDVDCDDANPAVNPDADELCNGIDDNCDDIVDDDAIDQSSGWLDTDRDGFGDPASPVMGCTLPRDTVFNDTDCGPDDPAVNPDATEVCNNLDDNCDGIVDDDAVDIQTGWLDTDLDGYGDPDSPVAGCTVPRNTADNDDDCGPDDPDVNPDMPEVCNSIDDNCDGVVDTDADDILSGWLDLDRDGFGDPEAPVRGCQLPLDTAFNDDDCAPDDAAIHPDATEVCDGLDNDCTGAIDDNEAIGGDASCAVQDCWAALDAGRESGPTWVLWNRRTPFEVYCEQEVDGGGWALFFKNHGGEIPGEASNATLLESDFGGTMLAPHDEELVSDVHSVLWNQVRGQSGLTFLKMGTMYAPDGAIEAETTLRVDFNNNTWDDILATPSNTPCRAVDTPFVVTANGNTLLGSTTYINSYQSSRHTFGLANSGHGTDDSCQQDASNLINDPAGNTLPRVDNGSSLNGVRHLFSYVHTAPNLRDASRCQFACWNEDNWGGYYDGFTWGVRQPRR